MDTGTSDAGVSATEQRKRAKDEVADETPRVKRQRVSRACDQCRAGREKCDGIRPRCGTCAFSERACTYDTQAKKRGIQPGYIRTLELSLAWLFSKYPHAESTLKRDLATENSQVQRLLSSKEGSESDRLHVRWSKGIVCKQIDQLLSGVEVSTPSHFGPEGDVSGSGDILKDIFPAENGAGTSLPTKAVATSSSTTPGTLRPTLPDIAQEADILHLPADFWRLLDVYYSFTHSWLPISEKHDILKTAYSYPPEGLQVESSDAGSGNHAELWAILALAAHQSNPRKEQNEIDASIHTARNLLPTETGPFELGHVRALILLSLIYIGRGDLTPAWILIGLGIRIAYELNLHKRMDLHLPRRKHVYLACYVIEAILGKLYGVPHHLRGQGVNPSVTLDEDSLEEWNPWDGGIIVTAQQSFGASRKPAQSMSIFNRLLGALRCEDGPANQAETVQQAFPHPVRRSNSSNVQQSSNLQGEVHSEQRGLSEVQQAYSGKKRGSVEDTEPPTPQQLHFEIIDLWLRSEQNLAGAKELWPVFIQRFKLYIQCFGSSRVPPTAVPLLEKLLGLFDLDIREANLRNILGALSHTWRQEVPIQAIAFQSTPGQDASPASILGEPLGPIRPYGTNSVLPHLHPMNPPLYTGAFGIDSGSYRSYPSGPEQLQMVQPGLPSQSQMQQNMRLPSGNNLLPSPVSQIPPPLGGSSHEQTQTADLEAIFEEIAMLDGNRQDGDRPEFMRNLGLGPDLDLSAFFGADYQPSDPLYSYLQPDTFGNDPENQGNIFPGG